MGMSHGPNWEQCSDLQYADMQALRFSRWDELS